MVADVPVGVLLSGGIDSSLVVALLAEAGQHGLQTFSIGFDSAQAASPVTSSPTPVWWPSDSAPTTTGSRSTAPGYCGIDAAIGARGEPMVSHDCVAFYLLSEGRQSKCQSGPVGSGRRRGIGGLRLVPAAGRRATRGRRRAVFGGIFRPPLEGHEQAAQQRLAHDHDAPTAFITERFTHPVPGTAVDAALRNDTTIMLVDDPVKRVDNMTMAWGLEARVPFLDHEVVELAGRIPPELKLADGGKGVLKRASRGVVPDEVIDRTKGYFPVPAIRQLEGPYLDRVRAALSDPAAQQRALFQPKAVKKMLADPNTTRTTLGSNALWQLAVLEMWLQHHDVH